MEILKIKFSLRLLNWQIWVISHSQFIGFLLCYIERVFDFTDLNFRLNNELTNLTGDHCIISYQNGSNWILTRSNWRFEGREEGFLSSKFHFYWNFKLIIISFQNYIPFKATFSIWLIYFYILWFFKYKIHIINLRVFKNFEFVLSICIRGGCS